MAVFVKFWGARGSIPTPASWTRVYGGNTPCVEVRVNDTLFICDSGSGIRELGKDIMARNPVPKLAHLLITHTHWDHIQGFPFFTPAYLKDFRIHLYAPVKNDDHIYRLLSGQMSSDYFPVSFGELGASIISDHLESGARQIDGAMVRSFPLDHPGGCYGYNISGGGLKIVYATDNELPYEIENGNALRKMPSAMLEECRDADLLIMDAQYDDETYERRRKWGHSSCLTVTDFAIQANVKQLALFHHDPESSDAMVDARVAACRKRVTALAPDSNLTIFGAREGMELKLDTQEFAPNQLED